MGDFRTRLADGWAFLFCGGVMFGGRLGFVQKSENERERATAQIAK